MGTYYALGIVKKFTAKSNQALSQTDWKKHLNERLDMEQYFINFRDNAVEGELKKEVFEGNIGDLYHKLVKITNNEQIAIYFEDSGTDMEKYQDWVTVMTVKEHSPNISIRAKFAILFIEGKVIAEEFSFEPLLMNWLFRHVDLSNPLSGCIMTDILG